MLKSRKAFLAGITSFTAMAATLPARAAVPTERSLWLSRAVTGESLNVPFTIDGTHVYVPGYRQLCWLLRDVHADDAEGFVAFSISTIEALWEIQQVLLQQGVRSPIVITSGYRTPATNAAIENAARDSQHLHATAVDMYVPGVSMNQLFRDCYSRAVSGGIGYYDDHIHLDTGPRRYWVGDVITESYA